MVKTGPPKGAAKRKSWPPDKEEHDRPPEDKHVEHRQSEHQWTEHERKHLSEKHNPLDGQAKNGTGQDGNREVEPEHLDVGHNHAFFRNGTAVLFILARFLLRGLPTVAVLLCGVAYCVVWLFWFGLYTFKIVAAENESSTFPLLAYVPSTLLALIAYQMIGLVENALQHIFRCVAILANRSGRIPSQRTLSSTVDAQGHTSPRQVDAKALQGVGELIATSLVYDLLYTTAGCLLCLIASGAVFLIETKVELVFMINSLGDGSPSYRAPQISHGVFFPELSPTVVIIIELLCATALSEISLDAQARPLSISAAQAHALPRHLNGSPGNAFGSKTSSSEPASLRPRVDQIAKAAAEHCFILLALPLPLSTLCGVLSSAAWFWFCLLHVSSSMPDGLVPNSTQISSDIAFFGLMLPILSAILAWWIAQGVAITCGGHERRQAKSTTIQARKMNQDHSGSTRSTAGVMNPVAISPKKKAPLFREWLLQVAQSAMPATAGEFATVWKAVIGVYALCSFGCTSASWIAKDELGTLKHLRRYLGMARWLSDRPFELVWVTYTLAPLVIRYILHPHPDGGLFRFVSRSSLSAHRHSAPPARTSNVQEINVRLAEMSSEASQWYRALGHKGLLHDRSMIHVLTHVTVLAGWCAKSFENLKDQIRDMNQRITGQQTTLLGEQARITMLYTAMEPLKNEFSASRSILAIVQSHISAVKGGLDRLQDTFGHLKSRFDGLQGRLTTSDNRIDELELQIQALRSSLESFRQGIHSAGLAQKESVQARLSPIENEVRNSQILARAPPPASGTVYTHRSVQSTSAPESPVMSEVSQGVKRLLEQQHLYKKKLDEQMCQLDDQIAGLERRMTAEQVSLRTGEEAVRARLDALAVSNEASQVLKEAKAFVREKFKKIVDASKLKFEEHGNRIAALEKDVYKPSLAPPMGERLEVLEYDVQKLTGKEMESAIQLCTALENLNVLQERMDNLRLDVKNAYKKVSTPEADRKSLYAHESAVQQLTTRLEMLEHDSLSHMDTMDHFQKRFEQVQHDCRQFLEKTQQLTGLEGPRLNDMERVLQKATEIFAIGLVQIKKQVEYLEQEFEGVGNEVGERLANYLDLASSERDRNAPSASPSICSVEAVHNHVHQSPPTAMRPPRPSDSDCVADSSTFPGGNSGIVDHRIIQEQGLAPLDTFSTSSTRNFSLEQFQRAFNLLTDRCRILEMKLERFESPSDARLGDLQRGEVAQQAITDLDRRVRLLEVELLNNRLGHNMATTQSSDPPAWLRETALAESSASALLTTRSTLEPFSADVLSSTDREEIAGRLRESDQSKPINPVPALPTFSSLASRESIQASVRPYEKTTPSASFQLALVQASSIWSPPSAELGPTSALEGKLERFEKDVNQQMSQLRANLERTMTSLQDLTLLFASAYGPVLSGDQQATVLEILEPASDPSDQPSTASKETILTPSFNDFKASLAALKDNFERMDLIVKQDTQKLVSVQRQLDETAMTTPASQINHLRDNVGYLTNRINTLEHNLHWKGVI